MNAQRENYEKSLNLTLQYFKEGNSMPEIAHKRKLAFSTVERHLGRLLENGKISISELLDEDKTELIKDAITGCCPLKEIKENCRRM